MRKRWAALFVGAAIVAGCAGEGTRAGIKADDPVVSASAPSETPPLAATAGSSDAPGAAAILADGASALRRIALLDDSAKRFPADPRVPGWLYAAGMEGAERSFFEATTAADSGFLAVMTESYYYNEIAGSHTYSGWHLTELVRRFPADTLADEAAFLRARNGDFVAGECEGFFFCYLGVSVDPWSRFLRTNPASPLVPLALAAADSALRATFDALEAGQAEFAAVDSVMTNPAQQRHQVVSVDSTLLRFEEAARALPGAERDRAMRILEPIRARWQRLQARPSGSSRPSGRQRFGLH